MKFNVIAITTLLSFASTNFAMLVKMPEEKELKNRLGSFANLTVGQKSVIELLAGAEATAVNVVVILERALENYYGIDDNDIQIHDGKKEAMQQTKYTLLEALLKEHPEALEDLKFYGFYRPKSKL